MLYRVDNLYKTILARLYLLLYCIIIFESKKKIPSYIRLTISTKLNLL